MERQFEDIGRFGRIVAVHPDSDGHIRVADVQVDKTVLKRPVAVLSPTEFRHFELIPD